MVASLTIGKMLIRVGALLPSFVELFSWFDCMASGAFFLVFGSEAAMMIPVFSFNRAKNKVVGIVVEPVAVFVMNLFRWIELAANELFHDPSVEVHPFAVDPSDHVAAFADVHDDLLYQSMSLW